MNMNSRKKRFAAILLAGITFICTSGITHVQVKADPVQEENVEEKIQQMSLAEKNSTAFFYHPGNSGRECSQRRRYNKRSL